MASPFEGFNVSDGDPVLARDMAVALTTAELVFGDGAVQTFTADGQTTYTEHGRPAQGEWPVMKDGEFSSFWPPAYRAAYTVRWIVEAGAVTGLSFTDTKHGDRFEGRYR